MSSHAIGTTRNLTQQFLRLRNEAKRAHPVPTSGSINGGSAEARILGVALGSDVEHGNSGASIAPLYLQKTEKIKADLGVARQRINRLKELHAKALRFTFDTEDDTQAHTEALTREIQSLFKSLHQEIGELTQVGSDSDEQVRMQIQRNLAQALYYLTGEFRKEETRFLNQVEERKGLAQGSTIGIVDDGRGSDDDNLDTYLTESQLAMVDVSDALARERDAEIRKIVETISELAQIMRDLATLVVDQGTILDRIDKNIETVAKDVDEGLKQIKVAEKTQKAGRMMMCIVALIVMIVVMLIIVIVRHAI